MSTDSHRQSSQQTEDLLKSAPLGHETAYVCDYDPSQLFPIPRTNNWQGRGYDQAPFRGCDIWNAYELSWLNLKGLPQVAIAEFRVPCESPHIIESKSFKFNAEFPKGNFTPNALRRSGRR